MVPSYCCCRRFALQRLRDRKVVWYNTCYKQTVTLFLLGLYLTRLLESLTRLLESYCCRRKFVLQRFRDKKVVRYITRYKQKITFKRSFCLIFIWAGCWNLWDSSFLSTYRIRQRYTDRVGSHQTTGTPAPYCMSVHCKHSLQTIDKSIY